MFESLYPGDDIWEKFGIPPMSTLFPEILGVEGGLDPPGIVPSRVMGGRHDCMWAGTCSHGHHQRPCCEAKTKTEPPEPVVAVTVSVRRSLLRTNRNRTRSASPRPETPSESEEEECSPVLVGVCDQEDLSVVVSATEVTGQIGRTNCEPPKSVTPVPPETPVPSYCSDHSYHINKSSVTLENLGVQTPSDSEEEIDVVSVVDREKHTTLPTNPSARDRQQLQLTVASAIKHRGSRGRKRNVEATSAVAAPPQPPLTSEKRPHKRKRARDESGGFNDKRREHNDMERQRRIDLRECIVNLRQMVPTIEKNERAAKVLILKEATKYVRGIIAEREELLRIKQEERHRQAMLKLRVKELRVQLRDAKMRSSAAANDKSPRKKRMGSR